MTTKGYLPGDENNSTEDQTIANRSQEMNKQKDELTIGEGDAFSHPKTSLILNDAETEEIKSKADLITASANGMSEADVHEVKPIVEKAILKKKTGQNASKKQAAKSIDTQRSNKKSTAKIAEVKEALPLKVKKIKSKAIKVEVEKPTLPASSNLRTDRSKEPVAVKAKKGTDKKLKVADVKQTAKEVKKKGAASISNNIEATPVLAAVDQQNALRRVVFQLRFFTHHGQSLSVSGNHPLLGNNNPEQAFPLQFLDRDNWYGVLELPAGEVLDAPIQYHYNLHDQFRETVLEWGNDKVIDPAHYQSEEILLIDSWNDSSFAENSFFTEPFRNVLLAENFTPLTIETPADYTHIFRVKAPLLKHGEVMCLLGSEPGLKEWNTADPILLSRSEDELYYSVKLNLSTISFPIVYKYGVYNVHTNTFVGFEQGNNRFIFDSIAANKRTVVSDGFAVLPNNTFRGTGVAIPVFSLRSKYGYGVGEFNDLKLLVDWAKQVGMKLIQILPVNDTTATHTTADSYPYAAISAFALHPMYLHIPAIIRNGNTAVLQDVEEQKQALQLQAQVDYKGVMDLKWKLLRQIFPAEKEETFSSDNFNSFFEENKHWLVPYAAFSYFRDENNTADFSRWSSHQQFNASEVNELAGDPLSASDDIAIHFFIQYHLHLQLQAATAYAHANGIIVKGDIPIGIYRNSCDAWQQPDLYNMEMQAGAPPDDFAIKGQNWGFPTYNWRKMQQDGFEWWKLRFAQMRYYFDAFRIDHILGFFRIWSIPMHAVEGIMGHFVPALPVHLSEFLQRGIQFDKSRFTEPYITDEIVYDVFGKDHENIKTDFLDAIGNGQYTLKDAFKTQRNVEAHFAAIETNQRNDRVKQGLFDLISNVLLFEADGSNGQQYHFRIAVESTSSFINLDYGTQQQLKELYVNYFFRRQDDYWEREALHKLPELKRSTNMLICGEDLGMVPDCVPGVMKRLSILSLEIQRMPKDPTTTFFHPNDAPYLSVVTPSTHDMSTIRGWWEEDPIRTQQFYNHELGQAGGAPYFCEPWINKAIVLQHLYSPAMWSIFQLQDLMGINDKIRRENPNDERINIPADPKHYWRYRIHIPLEELIEKDAFNNELKGSIQMSGRL